MGTLTSSRAVVRKPLRFTASLNPDNIAPVQKGHSVQEMKL